MPRVYTKVEILSEERFRRKAAGETNREIAGSYGLTLKQVKKLITRQNNKVKKIANGYIPRPKGRPCKNTTDEEIRRNNELIELRMQMELLRSQSAQEGFRAAIAQFFAWGVVQVHQWSRDLLNLAVSL